MRADFAADLDPARLRFAQNPDAAGRADMLAVNVMVAQFRQEDVTHDDGFLACARPAGQAEERAPVTFVNHTRSDEIVVLAVVENREAHHARVLDGTAHQFVILDASPIIGDRDDTGLPQRTDRRQFFAHQAFRDRARGQHVDARDFSRAILDPGDRAGTVRDRRRIRHADDGGESTRRRRPRAGLDRLFPAESRLAEMDVEVDQAGSRR